MGKYAVLITFAAALSLAFYSQAAMQTDQATNEDQVERQETVLARSIARSAFNIGESEARRGVGQTILSKGKDDVRHEGGEFDLTYSNLTTKTIDKINWRLVDIMAEGRYPVEAPQEKYRITATARQAISEDVNGITAGGEVGFDADGPGCDECISGNDAGGGKKRYGISIRPDGNPEAVCDSLRRTGKVSTPVVGKDGGCSVKARTEERDDEVSRFMSAIGETIRESSSDKVEIYDGGSVENNTSSQDPGILYIEDGKEAEISSDWHGLVFVSNSEGADAVNEFSERGQITVNGQHSIRGALLMQKGSRFLLDGGGTGDNVQYNTNRLLKLVRVLPMLGEPVEIRRRSQRNVR